MPMLIPQRVSLSFSSCVSLVYFAVNDIYCIVVFSNSTENVNFGNISEVKQHTHTDREGQTHTRIQKYTHIYIMGRWWCILCDVEACMSVTEL